MTEDQFVCMVTPKCLAQISEETKAKIKEHFPNIRFEADHNIYMNMIDGWSEDKCDTTAYLVNESEFKRQSELIFNMQPPKDLFYQK